MDAFRVMINNLFKEIFYGKRKKKINILTVFYFFIFYKNCHFFFLKMAC